MAWFQVGYAAGFPLRAFQSERIKLLKNLSLRSVLLVLSFMLVISCGGKTTIKDKVFLDTNTKLMWAVNPSSTTMNWTNAVSYCTNYRAGGYSDWRMPTLNELNGLYAGVEELDQSKSLGNIWASDTRGLDAAAFYFDRRYRGWSRQSVDNVNLALPVRSAK